MKNVSTVTFDTDDHAQVANLIVAEGAVLLKNEKNALPMKGGKISLFGIDNKSGVLRRLHGQPHAICLLCRVQPFFRRGQPVGRQRLRNRRLGD